MTTTTTRYFAIEIFDTTTFEAIERFVADPDGNPFETAGQARRVAEDRRLPLRARGGRKASIVSLD